MQRWFASRWSTHNFCLFFGPGRGLVLALSSTPSPNSLFTPVLGPNDPFKVTFSVGVSGTSDWGGGGGGDGFSSGLTGTTLAFSFGVGVDGDGAAVFGKGALRGGFSWGNRVSIDDGRVNLTVRLGLEPLPLRTVAGGVATLDTDVEPRRRAAVDLVFPPMVPYDGVSP